MNENGGGTTKNYYIGRIKKNKIVANIYILWQQEKKLTIIKHKIGR